MTSARCGCAIIVQACDRRCCSCCVESQHHLKKTRYLQWLHNVFSVATHNANATDRRMSSSLETTLGGDSLSIQL